MMFSFTFPVIPGEREAKLRVREGDPGGSFSTGADVATWVPFPSLRSAGDDMEV
jgi:hypothetical protein